MRARRFADFYETKRKAGMVHESTLVRRLFKRQRGRHGALVVFLTTLAFRFKVLFPRFFGVPRSTRRAQSSPDTLPLTPPPPPRSTQVLIVSLGSLSASTPYLAAILVGIIGVWFSSAKSLGGMIKKFEDKDEADALAKDKKSAVAPKATVAAA